MSNFYKQYKSIEPWLKRKDVKTDKNVEHLQTSEDRKKLDGMYEVGGPAVLCSLTLFLGVVAVILDI